MFKVLRVQCVYTYICVCVFISRDFLPYLLLKPLLYIFLPNPSVVLMAFFLPLYWLFCQHPSASITDVLVSALYNTIEVLLGVCVCGGSGNSRGGVVTVCLKALTGVAVRCCFWWICMDSDFKGCAVLWISLLRFLQQLCVPSLFRLLLPFLLYPTTAIITSCWGEEPLPPAPLLPLLILLPLCAYLLF